MNRKSIKTISIILILLILLSGCSFKDAIKNKLYEQLYGVQYVSFSEMEYVRPDIDLLINTGENLIETARNTDESDSDAVDMLLACLNIYYEEYLDYGTMYQLSHIHYCMDLTDEYWINEYDYCTENMSAAERNFEKVFRAIANLPVKDVLEDKYLGEGYFDAYVGESVWDDELEALFGKEYELQGKYYEITQDAFEYEFGSIEFYDNYADKLTGLLIELVKVRKEIALYFGYDSYTEFANEYYHYRDYTSEEVNTYLNDIQTHLSPLYGEISGSHFDITDEYCSERETFAYLKNAAKNMGGKIYESFRFMDKYELYDISYGENKYITSYETYLLNYMEPFLFVSPFLSPEDKLIFTHEFGHFCNDYLSYGTYAGTDVAEIFSQGMEYLSLCYSDEDVTYLTKYRIADSLLTYVEQAAFSYFEEKLYSISDANLTVEYVYDIYDEVAILFGFGAVEYDKREFTSISHFYTNPVYMIGYVLSEDAALQIYEMELKNKGSGLKIMEDNLDTQESSFTSFISSSGLENPLDGERVIKVRELYEEILFE